MKSTSLLLLITALLLAACMPARPAGTQTENPIPDTGTAEDLSNTRWQLVSFGLLEDARPVQPEAAITLEFGADGQAAGLSGCNSYGGPYEVQDGSLKFGEIVSTLIACDDQAIASQEQEYLKALTSSGRFAIAGDTLTIWYDGEKGVLNFVRAPASNTPAQTPPPSPGETAETAAERVEFATGASSVTLSGDLPEDGTKEYVLQASAGQSLHIQTVGYNAPVQFTLRSPSGETWPGETQASEVYIFTAQVVLPEDGDYRLTLSVPPDKGAAHYDVIFTLASSSLPAAPAPTEPPERVEFAPGAVSAQRSGLLPTGLGVKQYVLSAKSGQTMAIDITSDGVPLSLTFTGPGGVQIFTESGQATPTEGGYRAGHSFSLAEDGDYLVTLAKADHTPSTNYTVDFSIK